MLPRATCNSPHTMRLEGDRWRWVKLAFFQVRSPLILFHCSTRGPPYTVHTSLNINLVALPAFIHDHATHNRDRRFYFSFRGQIAFPPIEIGTLSLVRAASLIIRRQLTPRFAQSEREPGLSAVSRTCRVGNLTLFLSSCTTSDIGIKLD